jgi:hypothetical protein
MDKAPVFDASNASLGEYSYKELPSADANGNALSYQVIIKENPTGYRSSFTANEDSSSKIGTFTFEEENTFSATIEWNDADHKDSRPSSSELTNKLQLYRRIGTDNYELVSADLNDTKIENETTDSWTITIANLPRYNVNNEEYDYVLVQGSINENNQAQPTALSSDYKTYYDNTTGSFGNDISLCHNGGIITEVLYKNVNFTASKIWKDSTTEKTARPTSTVTLWRYIKNEASSIDDAYEKGVAAQVVFQTNENGSTKENIIVGQLSRQKYKPFLMNQY